MRRKSRFHSVDTMFTFLLLLSFLLFALLLAAAGSAVYKKSAAQLQSNYTSRTALSYVTEKLRQHDSLGNIRFSEVDNHPALVLHEEINGSSYLTYIYFYDGALRELFTAESSRVTPDMGSTITELSDFSFRELSDEGDTLLLEIFAEDTDGHRQSGLIHLQAERSEL